MATEVQVALLLAEFVGTLALVFTVSCCVLTGASPIWAPTAIALVLMAFVYSFGHVSGGHFNPAVSLACGLTGKTPWSIVAPYAATQVLAGVAANLLCGMLLRGNPLATSTTSALGPRPGYSWWEVLIAEALYTAMLAFVVLSVAASRCNNPEGCGNQFFALAIGFVVIAGGYGAGAISGAAFNPAVSLGLGLWGWASLRASLLYTLFQALGSGLAALLFYQTRPEDFMKYGNPEVHRPALTTKLACEFIGTFFLVFTVGTNLVAGSACTAWAAAAALTSMVYALGDVSGAHFNPAVTVAVVIGGRGSCPPEEGVAFIGIQLLSGVIAGFLCGGLADPATAHLKPVLANVRYGVWAASELELFFTLVLAFVVLSTATVVGVHSRMGRNFYFGLAIGASVVAGGVACGGVSGGYLNPAVTFGASMAALMTRGAYFSACWKYMLAQFLGGAAAAGVFHVTHAKEFSKRFTTMR